MSWGVTGQKIPISATGLASYVSPHRQRVISLRLPSKGLQGTISPHIGNLSFLMTLNLGNNSFHGHLIEELSRLRRLTVLILDKNHFEGVIPASLHHCRRLQVMSMPFNRLTGGIPSELSTLPWLRLIFLGRNNLTGTIPPSLGNMSSLVALGLEQNKLHGNIPAEIGHIPTLEGINFYENHLTGHIPPSIFNSSSLFEIALSLNGLSGNLPSTTGRWLPTLELLNLGVNLLSGHIPLYLSNLSSLIHLYLPGNQFSGTVPMSLGQLELLIDLNLENNQLTLEPGSHEISFLTALTNLRSLETLIIDNNPFNGILPDSIGNLSSSLQMFFAPSCQIKGRIPEGIGSMGNLTYLVVLSDNNLNGTIPSTIGEMRGLQRLYLDGNEIEGSIPKEICHLGNLGEINLLNNKLSGPIPGCVGNLSLLQKLFLDSNTLNSSIPLSLWNLYNLLFLNLSFNSLSGSLDPNINGLKSIESIDSSWNQISNNIPSTTGAFQSLTSLNLSRNSFWGPIPESFGNLITLDFMDLSLNNLAGPIPKSLEALSHLKHLNLSYNKLFGEIPSGGPFVNFTVQSFIMNEALCGKPVFQVPPCTSHDRKSKSKHFPFKYILPAIASVAIFASLLYMGLRKNQGNHGQSQNSINLLNTVEHKMISYQELCRATNNLCESNLLGVRGFGSVYKGILSDGAIVAVKILNLQMEGAFKSFDAECHVPRTVRHRNLVKVISSCSNLVFRALVLQYMSNGCLEKWLYSHNYCLDLLQRMNIMFDVALALEYLHYGQSEPVVHCDLKASNVLLDEEMVAHVGDFGIAKILAQNKTQTITNTISTLGYIAPEYGFEGRVTTKGGVYSYGIMLLETFTRKKPTDEMFAGELSLRQWVGASLPNKIMEIVDSGLLASAGEEMIATQNRILSIMEIGLECCRELSVERSDIKEAIVKLNKIRTRLHQNQAG